MEGVTELATRLWYSLTSAPEIMGTPFFRMTSTFPIEKLSPLFAPELTRLKNLVSYKLLPQLMGPDPIDFVRMAEHLLKCSEFVDLNCGCPSPTVVGGGSGSSLLFPPERFAHFAENIVTSLGPGKVSIKMRTGFSSVSEFPALLSMLTDLPLAQLTIHGRTKEDRYTGKAKWDPIDSATMKLGVPIIGSGDIFDLKSFRLKVDSAPRIRGVIVGRGALRNPWIFSEIRSGETQTLSVRSLLTSLAVFGVMQTAYHESPNSLLRMADEGMFLKPLNHDLEKWEVMLERSAQTLFGSPRSISNLELPPKIVSRIKMLWHNLRSSLPDPFFDGKVLRAGSFLDIADAIRSIATQFEPSLLHELPLNHNSKYDWLYSGSKKQTDT